MRLWSIHPKYLDAKGLVALWRETLLAQNVLQGKTKGYKNHPQLIRFKNTHSPVHTISFYLHCIADEADIRGYEFNRQKIVMSEKCHQVSVTTGQVEYELHHLLNKLKSRDPIRYEELKELEGIDLHPLFFEVHGDIEEWEIVHL